MKLSNTIGSTLDVSVSLYSTIQIWNSTANKLLSKIAAERHVGSSPTKYVFTNTDGETGRHGYHTNKTNSSIN